MLAMVAESSSTLSHSHRLSRPLSLLLLSLSLSLSTWIWSLFHSLRFPVFISISFTSRIFYIYPSFLWNLRSHKEDGHKSPSPSPSPPSPILTSPRTPKQSATINARYYETVPGFIINSTLKTTLLYRDHGVTVQDVPITLQYKSTSTSVSSVTVARLYVWQWLRHFVVKVGSAFFQTAWVGASASRIDADECVHIGLADIDILQ